MAEAAPADVVTSLAPSGRLRAAINFGNPVLAQKGPGGEAQGVSVALARELGRQLDVPVDLVTFNEAGAVFAASQHAGQHGAWDVAFLAIDPVRAAGIDFTAPYVVIEGTYAVPVASKLQSIADVDQAGVQVAVAKGSAYDLFLTRAIKSATILRADDSAAALAMLEHDRVEALAGVKQPLVLYAQSHPAVRVIPGRFMDIEQAMALPKGRATGLAFLRRYVETMKASGFVARELAASGQADATVAPAASGP